VSEKQLLSNKGNEGLLQNESLRNEITSLQSEREEQKQRLESLLKDKHTLQDTLDNQTESLKYVTATSYLLIIFSMVLALEKKFKRREKRFSITKMKRKNSRKK